MPRPSKGPRLITRNQGGARRYYADLRSIGRGRVALIPKGETQATTDPVLAAAMLRDLLRDVQEEKRNKHLLGIERSATLQAFSSYHLVQKAQSGRVTAKWIAETEKRLKVAVEFFGAERELDTIGVREVQQFANWLGKRSNGRGGTMGPKTQLEYLGALSNLYQRAQSEASVPPGYNPVAAMMDRPRPEKREARWLEVWEGALLLQAAQTHRPNYDSDFEPLPPKTLHAIVATFLLTGGRKSEVLGLFVEDLSFDRRTVTFRPHAHRRLKTSTSFRTVPMWPQLEEILRPYVFGGDAPRAGLLFPSVRTGKMITDLRKPLDAIQQRAGWKAGELHLHLFRHTYAAARLQTLDRGAPVSPFTVARELGHGGDQLVRRIYGHLGEVRHRSEVVEYRLAQHLEVEGLRERVRAL